MDARCDVGVITKAKMTKSKPARKATRRPSKKAAKATAVGQTFSWLNEALTSPLVREAISAALIAGAAAAAGVFAGGGQRQRKARSLGAMLSDATKGMAGSAVEALADAANDAAKRRGKATND